MRYRPVSQVAGLAISLATASLGDNGHEFVSLCGGIDHGCSKREYLGNGMLHHCLEPLNIVFGRLLMKSQETPTVFWWYRPHQDISTTITAATRLIIVDDSTNATISTSLIFNDLPAGYSLPPMNDAGTQTRDITYTAMGGEVMETKLTFPTGFTQFPTGYFWSGQFPTIDDDGQFSCMGELFSSTFRPYTSNHTKQPEEDWDGGAENGLDYVPRVDAHGRAPKTTLNPADPYLESCIPLDMGGGVGGVRIVQYLTVTSVERRKASAQTAAAAPPASAAQPEDVKQNSLAASAPLPAPDRTIATSAAAAADAPKPGLPQQTVQLQTPAFVPAPPAQGSEAIATTVIIGAGFSLTLEVPNTPATQALADPGVERTVLDGQTFVPFTPNTPPVGPTPANIVPAGYTAVAQSLTIIDGRTFAPTGVAQSSVPNGVAPLITVAGSTSSAVATVAGLGPAYNIAGQALAVGTTITIGSGANAQTLALSIDGQGTTVLLSASAGVTQTSALEDAKATSSATDLGIGDAIASGLGETRIGFGGGTRSSVAVQTASVAPHLQTGSIWLIVASLFSVIIWS